ncbi:MAG: 8-oxo-dGTP pyrophosphatase MutT (NUDIX family) [Cellvibrionaceae bacterium]|jgi:8-oxo-dGTP pyrophosphatase MutT (NUDIX family)
MYGELLDNMTEHKDKRGWQTKTTAVVYDNPWIRVSHDTVVTPAGTDGIYGRIHFKNHAVGILPIDDKGGTWLVHQSRYLFGSKTWEIPEGGSPEGEDLLLSAQRELLEETGLSATQWQPWLAMQLSNSVSDEVATVFLAQGLTQGEMNLEVTEDITVRYLPLKEAIAMVYEGEIVDAISVAALLKAAATKDLLGF